MAEQLLCPSRGTVHTLGYVVNLINFSWILAGVILNATAQLLLKAGTNASGPLALAGNEFLGTVIRVGSNPFILGGLSCYVVSFVIWIVALSRVDVSVAYPMLSMGYIINAVVAWQLLGESLAAQKVLGIGVIILGVYIVANS